MTHSVGRSVGDDDNRKAIQWLVGSVNGWMVGGGRAG